MGICYLQQNTGASPCVLVNCTYKFVQNILILLLLSKGVEEHTDEASNVYRQHAIPPL